MQLSQMQVFDVLYALAARDGREAALFGDSITYGRPAFEKTLIGTAYPTVYLEFPLLGDPCFDILTIIGSVDAGDAFAPGAGYGYQAMFEWFAGLDEGGKSVSCGIEVDVGHGERERAGVYVQYRDQTDLIPQFFEAIGEKERTEGYLAMLERMPKGWPPAYAGLFPGRAGTPVRIGGYMSRNAHAACSNDPAELAKAFDAAGFGAYDQAMLSLCSKFMALAPQVDFQFDIMPDGSFGNTFGLSLSFNETVPRNARECMETGYGAKTMMMLEGLGLADDRWKLLANSTFARHIPYTRADGTESRLALVVCFNYAKIKFVDGVAQPAKFYLALKAGDVG